MALVGFHSTLSDPLELKNAIERTYAYISKLILLSWVLIPKKLSLWERDKKKMYIYLVFTLSLISACISRVNFYKNSEHLKGERIIEYY